jgi:biopolymer transport protein ExbB
MPQLIFTRLGCQLGHMYTRTTTAAHELAAALLFNSGLIHYADKPEFLNPCPKQPAGFSGTRPPDGMKPDAGPFAALADCPPQDYNREMMVPILLKHGGPMMWLLLLASAVAVVVFMERFLHYHRAQINSNEFINGVKNVVRRDNIVEAISICEATPGPVARLVKTAILSRERGREGVREALEEAGLLEVPRLEEKLNLLATIAQITPLMGLLGTVLGFIRVFRTLNQAAYPNVADLSGGVWEALVCTALGLAVAIPCYAGYNYLVSRVNAIVLDMEKAATEILNIVTENNPKGS